MKPNLFIIGQPKSGTTALYQFLEQHPDVGMARPKEPSFFSKDFHKESDTFHKKRMYFSIRTLKQYMNIFPNNKKILGEASTNYLYSKIAIEEINKFNSKTKIIILLREPVNFMHSLHNQYVNEAVENEENFEKVLKLEEERKQGKNIPKRVRCPSYIFYKERAKYSEQIERVFKHFKKEQVKIIIFEEFKKNNLKTYKEVLKFLEIPYFEPEFKEVHGSKKPKSKILNKIIRTPIIKKIFKVILPMKIYEPLQRKIQKILMRKAKKELINPQLKQKLMKEFKLEVKKTGKLINKDLIKMWGYDKI